VGRGSIPTFGWPIKAHPMNGLLEGEERDFHKGNQN